MNKKKRRTLVTIKKEKKSIFSTPTLEKIIIKRKKKSFFRFHFRLFFFAEKKKKEARRHTHIHTHTKGGMSETRTKISPLCKTTSGNWTRYEKTGARNNAAKVSIGSPLLSKHSGLGTKPETSTPQTKGWAPSTPRTQRRMFTPSSQQQGPLPPQQQQQQQKQQQEGVGSPRALPVISGSARMNTYIGNRKSAITTPLTGTPTSKPTPQSEEKAHPQTKETLQKEKPFRYKRQTIVKPPPPGNTEQRVIQAKQRTPSPHLSDTDNDNNNEVAHPKAHLGTNKTAPPSPRVAVGAGTSATTHTQLGMQKTQQKRLSEAVGSLHVFTDTQFENIENSNVNSGGNSTEARSLAASPMISSAPLNTGLKSPRKERMATAGGSEGRYQVQPLRRDVPQNTFPVPTPMDNPFPCPDDKGTVKEKKRSEIVAFWDVFGLKQPRKVQPGDALYEKANFFADGTSLPNIDFVFGTKDSYGNEINVHALVTGPEDYENATSDSLISSGFAFSTNASDTKFDLDLSKYNQATANATKERSAETAKRKAGEKPESPRFSAQTKTPRRVAAVKVPENMEVMKDVEMCSPSDVVEVLLGTSEGAAQARDLEVTKEDLNEKNTIKVCVCGTGESGKWGWITRLLGYSNSLLPDFNYLSKKVKINGIVNNVLFAVCNNEEDSGSPIKYRWADAFVLAFSVADHKSYEAITKVFRDIMKDNGGRYKPTVIVMNVTNNYREESSWKVSATESTVLSEILNVKVFRCDSPSSVVDSFKALCSIYKSKKTTIEKRGLHRTEATSTLINSFRVNKSSISPSMSPPLEGSPNTKEHLYTRSAYNFVVLGDTFVGKTTFVQSFSSGTFTKCYTATTAYSSIQRIITHENSTEKCTVKLVDTPGLFFIEQGMTDTYSEDTVDNSVMATIQWLKRESLLHAHGYIILFSYVSVNSFEYACKLLSSLNTATLAPKYVVGTKNDLIHAIAVPPQEAEDRAKELKFGLSSLSLKSATQKDITDMMNKIIKYFADQELLIAKESCTNNAITPQHSNVVTLFFLIFSAKENNKAGLHVLWEREK